MNKAIIVMSAKGGVGKTTFSRFVGELHRRAKTGALLVDGDPTVGQFLKSLGTRGEDGFLLEPQPREGVATFAFHGDERDRERIADVLADEADTVIIIDLPASSLQYIERLEAETGFLGTLASKLTIVTMITPDEEARRDLADAMTLVPGATHVAVLNRFFGDEDDWDDWTSSPTRTRLIDAKGIEISLPRLKPRIADRLKKHHIGFFDGANSAELNVLDRGRMQRWAVQATEEIGPAFEALGLKK